MDKGSGEALRIAEKTHHIVDGLVKTAMSESNRQTGNSPDSVYVGIMACLAAAMATAPVLAKKPEWAKKLLEEADGPDDIDENTMRKIVISMTSHEALMFTVLAVAYTMQDYSEEGNLHTGFGPPQLWQALQAWSKIFPDRLADNYFEPSMLDAARKAGKSISEPFDALLAGRITHRSSPGSLN